MTQGGNVTEEELSKQSEQAVQAMRLAYVDFKQQIEYLHKLNTEMEKELRKKADQQRIAQIHNALKNA